MLSVGHGELDVGEASSAREVGANQLALVFTLTVSVRLLSLKIRSSILIQIFCCSLAMLL
jgi:hypothetical protein